MSSQPLRLALIMLGLGGLLLATSPAAVAQSDRELRREIETLRSENDQLMRQLEELKRQLAELQARNARLEEALTKRTTATTPPPAAVTPGPVSIDETNPDASPRALFKAMKASHDEAMQDFDLAADPTDKEFKVYLRELSRWIRRANREFKSQVVWHVKVLEGREVPGEFILRVVAIDPMHGTELGDPFDVLLSRSIKRHVEQIQMRGSLDELVLRGALQPGARLNPDRRVEGPFNNPPLLGPYVEFELGVTATSMITPEQAASEDAERKRGAAGAGKP